MTSTAVSETAQKLKAALKLLEKRGWCQHHYSCGGKFCGVGACYEVGFESPDGNQSACGFLSQIIDENFITWQDRPERTFAEVKAVFEKAIEANL